MVARLAWVLAMTAFEGYLVSEQAGNNGGVFERILRQIRQDNDSHLAGCRRDQGSVVESLIVQCVLGSCDHHLDGGCRAEHPAQHWPNHAVAGAIAAASR